MDKDSPESIIIWHKMERSGFLPASSICVKNACWGISRLELEHQCHGQAPAASHRTILEGKSSKAETSLALVTTTAMAWPSLDTNTPHWIHLNISAHPFHHTSEGIQCQQLWERRNSVQPLPAIEITVQKWHLPKNPPGRASNQTCKTHFPTLENLSGCNDSCGILTGLVNWSKVCGKVYNQDLK